MSAARYILYAVALVIAILIVGTIIMDIKTGTPIPKSIEGFAAEIIRFIHLIAGKV